MDPPVILVVMIYKFRNSRLESLLMGHIGSDGIEEELWNSHMLLDVSVCKSCKAYLGIS